MFKVKREGTGTICDTCRNSQIVRGPGGQQAVICHAYGRDSRITFPIMDCSIYNDKRQPTVYEMEQMAWVFITEAKHGQKVGFYSPTERRKNNIDDPEVITPGF